MLKLSRIHVIYQTPEECPVPEIKVGFYPDGKIVIFTDSCWLDPMEGLLEEGQVTPLLLSDNEMDVEMPAQRGDLEEVLYFYNELMKLPAVEDRRF